MKTKSILSALILLVFAVLGGGSLDENGNIAAWFWIIISAFVIIFIIMFVVAFKNETERTKRKEKARLEWQAKLKAKEDEYNAQKQQFITDNGQPEKSIIIEKLDMNSEIHVFENSKRVFILGKDYSFKDIISCTFSDNPRVIKGKVTAVTKSKNGNVIGRAIVGDVIAGPAGAIIGGTTAKKHTEYIQGDDKTEHDYTVIINVDSISEPVIRIHTGRNGKLTNEIVGLMNVIISRK